MDRLSDGMTLEELREEYDWIYRFQSRMAEHISGDPDAHNLVDYVNRLEAENTKLRTFLGGGSIVTDYWKDEDGTMHVLTTDGEHTYEYMRGGLADENVKLRELIHELLTDPDAWDYDYFKHRMSELGVEV